MSHEETSRALAELARDATSGDVPADVHAAGRARLLDAIKHERHHERPRWLGVALVAAAAVVLAFWLHSRPGALTYTVEGAVTAFSDGTSVKGDAATRMHVADVTPRGARVVLEAGTLDVDVMHNDGARWIFEAGPYTVNVTGTAFTLTWSAADDRLDVQMKRGSVIVEGPLASPGVAVVGGQTLDAQPREQSLSVKSSESSIAAPQVTTTVIAEAPTAPTEIASATSPEVRVTPGDARTWTASVAAGDYARVMREAEDAGLDATLSHRSLADVAALADAARYVRRFDVATRALSAERSRFSGTTEARAAAFMLGRTAEDSGDPSRALGFYDDYLRETPDGALAAEALGRKLAVLRAQKRTSEAHPVAVEYLRRFPNGGYARVAHEVADSNGP